MTGPTLVPEVAAGSTLRSRRATDLLALFDRAGVLAPADVHVATRVGTVTGESDERVLLACALTVRAVRLGSSCLRVEAAQQSTAVEALEGAEPPDLPWPDPVAWLTALAGSPAVDSSARDDEEPGQTARPLRLVDGLLYLDRYWRQEQAVAEFVDTSRETRLGVPDAERLTVALERVFPSSGPDAQREAAGLVAHRRLSMVVGGPGTGKTTTVARLLAVLQDLHGGQLRVALAAPTGKAAARLTDAVAAELGKLDGADQARVGDLRAVTVHRLLGSRFGQRTRFFHDGTHPLPFDLVVVDEASMVSLTLMARLMEAVRPDARLVLVGDPDQLSSVEVGAVLGDLVAREDPDAAEVDAVVHLQKVHRFGGGILDLAAAVRDSRAEDAESILRAGLPDVELIELPEPDAGAPTVLPDVLLPDVETAGRALLEAARAGDAEAALGALDQHRVLCGHRRGPRGAAQWAHLVEQAIASVEPGYGTDGLWYLGRPLIVTANDYATRLFNGDTGVVVRDPSGEGLRAAFRRDAVVSLVPLSRLGQVDTVHALSVHRSQGSQFQRVTVVLPPEGSPLLTRELLYTAVTRAETHVRVLGSWEALRRAIETPVQRASGLRRR